MRRHPTTTADKGRHDNNTAAAKSITKAKATATVTAIRNEKGNKQIRRQRQHLDHH